MFLKPPGGARVDKRTLCFRIGNLCSDAALVGRDAANEVGSHCCYPFPTQRSDLQGTSRTSDLLTPTIFLFFPFWEPDIKDQDIQKQLHIQEKNRKQWHKPKKRLRKDTKRYQVYASGWADNQTTTNKSKHRNPANPDFNFQGYHIIIFKCLLNSKK